MDANEAQEKLLCWYDIITALEAEIVKLEERRKDAYENIDILEKIK